MIPLRAPRAHPHYADLSGYVPKLLWPILWWQLNVIIFRTRDQKITDACFQTGWWGFFTIRFATQADNPSLYKPIPRTFRELSDPSREIRLPDNLECVLSIWQAAGGGAHPHPQHLLALPLIPAKAGNSATKLRSSALNHRFRRVERK